MPGAGPRPRRPGRGHRASCPPTHRRRRAGYSRSFFGEGQVDALKAVGTTPPPGKYFENLADFAINDNATVESPIAITGVTGNAPATLKVGVDIKHTYIGDLKVDLVAPDGTVYTLHNHVGGSADNIAQTYTVNASSEVANGTWKLRVNDNAASDTGKIDAWNLTF
jgi:subtilisin-like proprotein convertase family protein